MDGVNSSSKISLVELEKHLSDYKKGRSYASKETAEKLGSIHYSSALEVSELNPDAGLQFSLFRSTLSYSAKARYTKNIDEAVRHIKKLYA